MTPFPNAGLSISSSSAFAVAALTCRSGGWARTRLLQVHRVIKELRVALVLSHHDGTTALTDHRNLLHNFLFNTSDLGNTPFRFDPSFSFRLRAGAPAAERRLGRRRRDRPEPFAGASG